MEKKNMLISLYEILTFSAFLMQRRSESNKKTRITPGLLRNCYIIINCMYPAGTVIAITHTRVNNENENFLLN